MDACGPWYTESPERVTVHDRMLGDKEATFMLTLNLDRDEAKHVCMATLQLFIHCEVPVCMYIARMCVSQQPRRLGAFGLTFGMSINDVQGQVRNPAWVHFCNHTRVVLHVGTRVVLE